MHCAGNPEVFDGRCLHPQPARMCNLQNRQPLLECTARTTFQTAPSAASQVKGLMVWTFPGLAGLGPTHLSQSGHRSFGTVDPIKPTPSREVMLHKEFVWDKSGVS